MHLDKESVWGIFQMNCMRSSQTAEDNQNDSSATTIKGFMETLMQSLSEAIRHVGRGIGGGTCSGADSGAGKQASLSSLAA